MNCKLSGYYVEQNINSSSPLIGAEMNRQTGRMLKWITIKFFEYMRLAAKISLFCSLYQLINPTHIYANSRTHCKTVHSFINNHNDGIIKINNRKMKSKTSSDVMTL